MFDKPDPFNKDFLAAWHARDQLYAKIADIKTIPATGDEVRFKFPDIRSNPETPKGRIDLIPRRRPNETIEEFGGRCVIITNIGDPKE